jgi:hypothetical protein
MHNDLCQSLLLGQIDSPLDIINTHHTTDQTIPSGSNFPERYSKLPCYDKEAIRALTLKMSNMLLNTTWIGTTPNALSFWEGQMPKATRLDDLDTCFDLQRKHSMHQCKVSKVSNSTGTQQLGSIQRTNDPGQVPYLLREGALLLYNSYPHSGKTTLVTSIAKEILKCDTVHTISAPAIFAKYGTNADAALETILHELVLRGAVKSSVGGIARVCIVLDHFETLIDHGSNYDSYTPVLNSLGEFIGSIIALDLFPS